MLHRFRAEKTPQAELEDVGFCFKTICAMPRTLNSNIYFFLHYKHACGFVGFWDTSGSCNPEILKKSTQLWCLLQARFLIGPVGKFQCDSFWVNNPDRCWWIGRSVWISFRAGASEQEIGIVAKQTSNVKRLFKSYGRNFYANICRSICAWVALLKLAELLQLVRNYAWIFHL